MPVTVAELEDLATLEQALEQRIAALERRIQEPGPGPEPAPQPEPEPSPDGMRWVGGLHPEQGQTLEELEQLYLLFGREGMTIDDFRGTIGPAMRFWWKEGQEGPNRVHRERVEVKFVGAALQLHEGKRARVTWEGYIPPGDSIGPTGDVVAPQFHTTGSNGRSPAGIALHQYNGERFLVGRKVAPRDWATDGQLAVPSGAWVGMELELLLQQSHGSQFARSRTLSGEVIATHMWSGPTLIEERDAPFTLQFGVYPNNRTEALLYVRNLDFWIEV